MRNTALDEAILVLPRAFIFEGLESAVVAVVVVVPLLFLCDGKIHFRVKEAQQSFSNFHLELCKIGLNLVTFLRFTTLGLKFFSKFILCSSSICEFESI